jgi:hypothetical protein
LPHQTPSGVCGIEIRRGKKDGYEAILDTS